MTDHSSASTVQSSRNQKMTTGTASQKHDRPSNTAVSQNAANTTYTPQRNGDNRNLKLRIKWVLTRMAASLVFRSTDIAAAALTPCTVGSPIVNKLLQSCFPRHGRLSYLKWSFHLRSCKFIVDVDLVAGWTTAGFCWASWVRPCCRTADDAGPRQ